MRWDGNAVFWRGEPSWQHPADLIRYQEILFRDRPQVVIETGGGRGTTAFLRDVCTWLGNGKVIPVQEDSLRNVPRPEGTTMAILDSDVYSETHMREEIGLYAPLVSLGHRLIVCHTDRQDWGAAPALAGYLASNPGVFEQESGPADSLCSYLRRVSAAGHVRLSNRE